MHKQTHFWHVLTFSDIFWHFPYFLRSDLARWKGQITSGNPFQRCQRGRVVWPHSQEADVYGCVIGVIDNFTTSYNFTILTYTYYTYSTSLHIAYYWLLLHTLGATHWNQNRSGPHRRPKLRRIVARAWKDGDREREKRVERCWKMLKACAYSCLGSNSSGWDMNSLLNWLNWLVLQMMTGFCSRCFHHNTVLVVVVVVDLNVDVEVEGKVEGAFQGDR